MPRATFRMRNLEANYVQIAANQAVASVAAASFKFVVVFVCSANDVKGNQKLYTHRSPLTNRHTHTHRDAHTGARAKLKCDKRMRVEFKYKCLVYAKESAAIAVTVCVVCVGVPNGRCCWAWHVLSI